MIDGNGGVIRFDSGDLRAQLDERGYALVPRVLDDAACRALRESYDRDELFRSTVTMERHGFGRGEYRYFTYPLPPLVRALRESLYAAAAEPANEWMRRLGRPERFPPTLSLMLDVCARGGQERSAALMLRYGPGDHNALHQDIYGEVAFPLQGTILLSDPVRDFDGGEFVLVEGRPRRQSIAHVVPLGLGDAVVFPNRIRCISTSNGAARTTIRHGVAAIRRGQRHALGLVLHDA